MDSLLIMDIVITILGCYLFFNAVQMKKTERISAMIVPEQEAAKCKDKKGYIRFVFPRMVIFSVITIITGIAGVIDSKVYPIPYWNWLEMVIVVIVIGYLIVSLRNARIRFF